MINWDKVKFYLLILPFRPSLWTRLYSTNESWDDLLNRLIDYHLDEAEYLPNISILSFNSLNIRVSIGSYPYDYGRNVDQFTQIPSRYTTYKLRKALLKKNIRPITNMLC